MTETIDPTSTPFVTGFISLNQNGQRRMHEVKELITIGRDESNGVALKDPYISARHARIERRDKQFVLRDLRSRNGTYLNDSKVLEAILSDGDKITVGQTEIQFTSSPEPQAISLALRSKNLRLANELSRVPNMAKTDLPILITGPSGSGKDVLANNIHKNSPRSSRPLVSVNCSALSEALIESELFGHSRGSFTGATHDRLGAFEAARGGTLFLDEIGDLPLALQPKLLRALENNEIRPVGSDKTIRTDVRILAATHQDLKMHVQSGRFREDLFFRLNVLQVQLPALTERMEDFEDLLYSFAKHYRVRFDFASIQRLKNHSWPGQIRELRNLVARAKAYFPGQTITITHLDELIETPIPATLSVGDSSERRPILKELELDLIQKGLIRHNGNQRRVARELGIPKSTLNDRIKSYGIHIPELLGQKPSLKV